MKPIGPERSNKISITYLSIKNGSTRGSKGLPRQSEQRVAYTINDLQTAQALLDAGADLIETDLIGELTGQLD